jgi:hypothetical protein
MKILKPHIDRGRPEDEDEGTYKSLTWCYGPQGHPASMRILLWQDENGPQVTSIGPGIQRWGGKIFDKWHTQDLLLVLQRLHCVGGSIEKTFGHAWDWHVCEPGCVGWERSEPKTRCRKCAEIRAREDKAAFDFFATLPDTSYENTT